MNLPALLFISVLITSWLSAADHSRPNILFIVADDLKPLFSAYGEGVPTPNLDRIAKAGTTFLNAHCQQALCAPSRASLLTGRRPDYIQIWDLITQMRDRRPDIVTLPQYFRSHGYETTGLGKIFDPRSVDSAADAPSWSVPFVKNSQLRYSPEIGEPYVFYQSPEVRAAAAGLFPAGRKPGWSTHLKQSLVAQKLWRSVESADVPDDAYDDGAMAEYVVRTLPALAASPKPFFLALGFKKPHLPFAAPKKYWDLFQRDQLPLATFRELAVGSPEFAAHKFGELRDYSDIPALGPLSDEQSRELIHGYYACIAYLDAQVGRVLDALERSGEADRTLIVLWGDHGWHLGDHGLWCKHTNFEQATRSPLLISAPGRKAPGGKVSRPVEFVDVFPTLVELAGLPSPDFPLDGVSLAACLDDPGARTKEFAVSQYPRAGRMGYALRTERYRLIAWFEVKQGGGADGSVPPEAVELYDYKNDPYETHSLTQDPAQRVLVDELLGKLRAFLAAQLRVTHATG